MGAKPLLSPFLSILFLCVSVSLSVSVSVSLPLPRAYLITPINLPT